MDTAETGEKIMNYKVVMAYDGTRYNGWQKQGNTDKTIQGKLEQILLKMTGEEIEVPRFVKTTFVSP